MTFLSISPDAIDAPVHAGPIAARRPRASLAGQVAAIMIVAAAMTVPSAMAQAKWARLTQVVTFVQQRCMAAVPG